MHFVIFGLSITSSWGNGHATIWRALCRALIGRGHRVSFFEKDVPYYAEHRDFASQPGLDIHLYTDWGPTAPAARRICDTAGVAMVTSFCPDGIAASELVLSSSAQAKVFYDLDTPVTLRSLAEGDEVSYLGPRGLRDFDLVLSFTGGRALDALGEVLHARRTAPFYGCVDPEVHAPAAADRDLRCDLSYLGTFAHDRQSALLELFVTPARRMPRRKFVLGGSLYPGDFPWTPNIHYVQHIAPPRHPAFYCSSRFTLNITRGAMAEMGYCPSGRLFEAAACGVPILTDTWEGLPLFFTPGEEITVVRTAEQVQEVLRMDDKRRNRIADAARQRVLSQHTGLRRAIELERILGETT